MEDKESSIRYKTKKKENTSAQTSIQISLQIYHLKSPRVEQETHKKATKTILSHKMFAGIALRD